MKLNYIRDGRSPIPKKAITSKVMSSIRAKNTKPEITLRRALWANGFTGYRLHWKTIPGRPDIVYTKRKVAIFVNGCFWHRCPYCSPSFPKSHIKFWKNKFDKNIERDERKTKELKSLGWKVITIWECEIKNNLHKCIVDIKNLAYN